MTVTAGAGISETKHGEKPLVLIDAQEILNTASRFPQAMYYFRFSTFIQET